jgi:hypothetical protein
MTHGYEAAFLSPHESVPDRHRLRPWAMSQSPSGSRTCVRSRSSYASSSIAPARWCMAMWPALIAAATDGNEQLLVHVPERQSSAVDTVARLLQSQLVVDDDPSHLLSSSACSSARCFVVPVAADPPVIWLIWRHTDALCFVPRGQAVQKTFVATGASGRRFEAPETTHSPSPIQTAPDACKPLSTTRATAGSRPPRQRVAPNAPSVAAAPRR